MERITKVLKTCSIAIVLLLVGMVIGWLCRPINAEDTIIVQRDTTIVHDTIVIDKPSEVRTEYIAEKILVEVRDTLWLHDTLFVQLPMQKKFYKEEDYYAEVSGYNPSLDYLEIYNKTVYVTKTERAKEKRNYLSAGVEVGWCSTFSTPIYLEYGRMLHKNVKFRGGVFRDVVKQENGVRFGIEAQIGW